MGEDAAHVGVHRGQVVVVGEDEDGARRVRADAGQRAQAVGRARQLRPAAGRRGGDGRRRALLQPPGPVVVAEALPAPQHVGERRRGETLQVGPGGEPLHEARRHPRHLGLLQHDLADQDRVGVGGVPPGQVAPVLLVPREQPRLQRARAPRAKAGERRSPGSSVARSEAHRREPSRRRGRPARGRRRTAQPAAKETGRGGLRARPVPCVGTSVLAALAHLGMRTSGKRSSIWSLASSSGSVSTAMRPARSSCWKSDVVLQQSTSPSPRPRRGWPCTPA